ncbi:DNA alkylation repair protein [Paenibacillus endoradicis]|uniref:DNA alkylation repair protein n=1 Tax=Paenibacillus endoradicis TaxID=2972487 RepID=UPI0021596601|nr:DNA alkylation repair protein [Paenibacillus endoradicis]MCR8657484.1 DNA alkylation repair protein [Paenibacillus endoradicis]
MTTMKEQLIDLAEEEYQKFSAALIPNINNVLGVRLPELRKIARKLAKNDWRTYLEKADHQYFEEIMLQGMVIGYVQTDIEERLNYISTFVPKIDNWSVCDSFCTGLKFTHDNRNLVWVFLQTHLVSNKEYEIRFGVVMFIFYYIDEQYIDKVLEILDSISHDGYYVKMAVAWAVSICYVKLPESTMIYLKDNTLDNFTYNKALQKITESTRIDLDTKKKIRSMKRK